MSLPDFVPPMLARLGEGPFDSDEHLFEIKWDGTRALAFRDARGLRLRNRNDREGTDRYPELAGLAGLPDGTVLDGEIVVLAGGRPDFEAMLRREQARSRRSAERLAAELPATYMVFDVIYGRHEPLMDRPLAERIERMSSVVSALGDPRVVASEGIRGAGVAFFEQACALELEGVVAKDLGSRYQPGRRTDAWLKIKRRQRVLCVVLGYDTEGPEGLKSLVVGTDRDGELRCVGRVGSGLSADDRARLLPLLAARRRARPLVDCGDIDAVWIEPGLICEVAFLEYTSRGTLRAPVFVSLVETT